MSNEDRNPFGYEERERGVLIVTRDGVESAERVKLESGTWAQDIDPADDGDEAAGMPSQRVDIALVATFDDPMGRIRDAIEQGIAQTNEWAAKEMAKEIAAWEAAGGTYAARVAERDYLDVNRAHRLGRMVIEWLKGCGNAPERPIECDECTRAFLEAFMADGERMRSGVASQRPNPAQTLRDAAVAAGAEVDRNAFDVAMAELARHEDELVDAAMRSGLAPASPSEIRAMLKTVFHEPEPDAAARDLHGLIALKSVGVRVSVRDHGAGVVVQTRVGDGGDVVTFDADSGRRVEIPVEVFVRTALPERE